MKCENEFCIYWDKSKCTLDEVALDIVGQCTECIYPSIDKKALKKAKEKTRKNKKEYVKELEFAMLIK